MESAKNEIRKKSVEAAYLRRYSREVTASNGDIGEEQHSHILNRQRSRDSLSVGSHSESSYLRERRLSRSSSSVHERDAASRRDSSDDGSYLSLIRSQRSYKVCAHKSSPGHDDLKKSSRSGKSRRESTVVVLAATAAAAAAAATDYDSLLAECDEEAALLEISKLQELLHPPQNSFLVDEGATHTLCAYLTEVAPHDSATRLRITSAAVKVILHFD